jgi:biopolymer transport protein ExbD
MKQKRRRLFEKRALNTESGMMNLQITSMADIFTILLVFLLKGIASDALAIAPSSGTHLPTGSNTTALSQNALQLEISPTGILVDKELVSGLESFEGPLRERLSKERARQKAIAELNESVKNDGRAIILSDQKVSFSKLKIALRILSENGYSEIKFGVIKE